MAAIPIITIPKDTITMGIQAFGPIFLSTMFEGISKITYYITVELEPPIIEVLSNKNIVIVGLLHNRRRK